MFQRDCGATTNFSTQIAILEADKRLQNEAGNILYMDGHPDETQLKILWLSNNHLQISNVSEEGKFENEIKLNNETIKITYLE